MKETTIDKPGSKEFYYVVTFLALIVLLAVTVKALDPTGATITEERSETAPTDSAGNHNASAGNVTELSITGVSTTQSWQGYFGNVTGTIQLADASDSVLYNWSLADPEGEVFASTNSTILWGNIQCFNFTADGTHNFTDNENTGGLANLRGTNLTQLEDQYNISSGDADGVNETFNATQAGGFQHDGFFVAGLSFSTGECASTSLFSSTGQGVANQFEEVLLYEPNTTSVVFASLIESGSVNGFDGDDYDFEMIVLENGHGTDTSTTPYYFFVELQ